jgi:tetratricopeptide (TPR) repeat protein
MRNFVKSAFVASFAFGLLVQTHAAHAVVTVMGQGMAQNCYETALALSLGFPAPDLVYTGSLIDPKPVDVCTLSIANEQLAGHDLAGTYVNRGVLYFLGGDYVTALRDFDQAVANDNTIGESYANRGAALVALHQWAPSLEALNKGIELGSSEPEKSYYNRAIANEELGKVKDAYYDYMKAAELKADWDAPKAQLTRFTVKRKTGT